MKTWKKLNSFHIIVIKRYDTSIPNTNTYVCLFAGFRDSREFSLIWATFTGEGLQNSTFCQHQCSMTVC